MDRCRNLPFETFVDWYEGRVDPADGARIRAHVDSGCATCSHRLAWVDRFLPALGGAMKLTEMRPSEAARTAVRNLFRERQIVSPQPSFVTRIAQLIFDSRQTQTPAVARGVDMGDYQMVYSTGDHDVDLWQERLNNGHWYLIGQVLPKNGDDAVTPNSVVLTSTEGRMLSAVPEVGEFHVISAPAGTYEVRLRLADESEIVLPGVPVGLA